MDKLKKIKKELENIISNFEKSKYRPYTEKTLKEKEETINGLLVEARKCVNVTTDAETALKLKQEYLETKKLIDNITELINNQRQSSKMAFDMRTATSLVQYYNGTHEDTESFIEAIELLDELTPADQKNTMIKFIKTRITGKAKYTITSDINAVAQIKSKLKQKFSAKLSSDALLTQLKACKQNNKKLEDFASQIEDLSRQLTSAFIAENVATG